MNKQRYEVRRHFVKTRLNAAELQVLRKLKAATTDRHLSQYVRKVLLQQPVTMKYRNASADDFLRDMLVLKQDLQTAIRVLNEAVQQLAILEKVPEFRHWLTTYDTCRQDLEQRTKDIQKRITQLYEQWLLRSIPPTA